MKSPLHINPFSIHIGEEILSDLQERIRNTRWPDQARYRNMDAAGVMHFPGYSVEAAKLLIERGAVGLGIDTLSIDYGASKNFEVHRVDLPAGLYNLENLANLDQLPEAGAFLIAAPIRLEGGSGGPVRVFAILPAK